MIPSKRPWLSILLILGLLLSSAAPVFAQDDVPDEPVDAGLLFLPSLRNGTDAAAADEDDTLPAVTSLDAPANTIVAAAPGSYRRTLPSFVEGLRLDEQTSVENGIGLTKLAPALRNAQGRIQAVIQLSEPSIAVTLKDVEVGASASLAATQMAAIDQQQAALVSALQRMDSSATVLGTVQKALNAVMVEADAAVLAQLAKSPAVRSVRAVVNYERDLSETVPYIGARNVQDLGFDGTGVKVAVLDSGIDYTHVAFGGAGTAEAYAAAYGTETGDPKNTTRDGLFPTAKVVEGHDFVGEVWPNGPLAEDEDPIDCGNSAIDDLCDGGHGTHVADIIGGAKGVAPGASLYAVKVCSAVSTSCSGVALIQAMDYILDPNDDLEFSDRMDIVNMSLGSSYGTAYDDDLSQAVENATDLGVLTVASAGNSSDKPFVVGTPSAASTALSVAQTSVPSAVQPLMRVVTPASAAGLYPAVFQPWAAPLTSVIEAPVVYGNADGTNRNGCAAFTDSMAGKIVLMDRGACNFTLKVLNAQNAGAVIGIIGLVAPGDPFEGGDGGDGPITIPGYMISQATANVLKGAGVTVRLDPAEGIPLAGHMVGSSSRGPSMRDHLIKPEIGAPGASVSAIAGTGEGTGPFGGTSGAAPMVSGAAALVMEAWPGRPPREIKAILVNTADTNVMNTPAFFGGDKAPITRIGGGEVRVDRALVTGVALWSGIDLQASISLGFNDYSTKNVKLRAPVQIRNYANERATYDIAASFRFAGDASNGAVKITAPQRITVPGRGLRSFNVTFDIDTTLLPDWAMNSGADGANANLLTAMEFDGYLTATEVGKPSNTVHLPWQILPRKASDVTLREKRDYIQVRNRGTGTTLVESYSLIGTSAPIPNGAPGQNNPTPDLRYAGYATYPVPAGFCSDVDSFVMAFAVNTFEPQTHAIAPMSVRITIDADQDGTDDYWVLSRDVSFNNVTDGRNLAWSVDLNTGAADAFFYTEHDTKSGNTVLLICGEQIGMDASDFFDPMNINVYADDFFNGGDGDAIEGITIAPLGEQYLASFETGGIGSTELVSKAEDKLSIIDFGPGPNTTEEGLLLLYRHGAIPSAEAAVVYPK